MLNNTIIPSLNIPTHVLVRLFHSLTYILTKYSEEVIINIITLVKKDLCECGLVWGAFRPSDDICTHHYNIPANMFISQSLQQLKEIFQEHFPRSDLLEEIQRMKKHIDEAIWNFGRVEKNEKLVYAYEVNGCGASIAIDDANVPSLLSQYYLEYVNPFDVDLAIRNNTRQFILSSGNRYYFSGNQATGIGK